MLKRGRARQIGRTKGGIIIKLPAVANAKGRPIGFFISAGQVSDYTGAAAPLDSLPKADGLLADRGYDADWLRKELDDKSIKLRHSPPDVPTEGRQLRQAALQAGNRIEIMFGRLKGWRRVATRYDRCPETFLSAIALAANVLFRL